MTSIHTCKYCGKRYSRPSAYERHVIACETKNITAEKIKAPLTPTELTEMMMTLMNRVAKLEEENQELKRYITKKKKKINILDWLENNKMIDNNFSSYLETIEITEEDFKKATSSKNHVDAISSVIIRKFPIEEYRNFPIVSFAQKPGVFYIYKKGTWNIMSGKEFNEMVNMFSNKLRRLFVAQFKDNNDIYSNDSTMFRYFEIMDKIIGKTDQIHDSNRKIKNILFDYFKYDIKSATEYQFVF